MDDAADPTPRWRQRFENFNRALARLEEAVASAIKDPDSTLVQSALIQRFEFTCELGWKTLTDLLQAHRIKLEARTPIVAIREAFAAEFISDGQGWWTWWMIVIAHPTSMIRT